MSIQIGDVIVYEHKDALDGRKWSCKVGRINGDWHHDINEGKCNSSSFQLSKVIIWEHHKAGK